MMGVNLDGVFLACQAQARVMLPRKKGSIINIGSISGSIVNQGISRAHYNASKAAVLHLTKSLAMVRRFRFQVPGSRGPGPEVRVQGTWDRVQGSGLGYLWWRLRHHIIIDIATGVMTCHPCSCLPACPKWRNHDTHAPACMPACRMHACMPKVVQGKCLTMSHDLTPVPLPACLPGVGPARHPRQHPQPGLLPHAHGHGARG